jgi:ribosomal protein S24E
MIRAFHEVVVRVQHINAIVHEVEAIHKVMSCILDRDKDLVQITRVQKTK